MIYFYIYMYLLFQTLFLIAKTRVVVKDASSSDAIEFSFSYTIVI